MFRLAQKSTYSNEEWVTGASGWMLELYSPECSSDCCYRIQYSMLLADSLDGDSIIRIQ